jgi:hypothetical protein
MDRELPDAVVRRLFEYAAGARPIRPHVAAYMLRIDSALQRYLPVDLFIAFPPQELAMLVALSEGTPRALIAEALDLSVAVVERCLRHSAALLGSNLLYWHDGGNDADGAAEREPRVPSPSGWSRQVALPFPPRAEQAVLAAVQDLLLLQSADEAEDGRRHS